MIHSKPHPASGISAKQNLLVLLVQYLKPTGHRSVMLISHPTSLSSTAPPCHSRPAQLSQWQPGSGSSLRRQMSCSEEYLYMLVEGCILGLAVQLLPMFLSAIDHTLTTTLRMAVLWHCRQQESRLPLAQLCRSTVTWRGPTVEEREVG